MFQHLDANSDGNIDLAEFTRFCLEVRAGCVLEVKYTFNQLSKKHNKKRGDTRCFWQDTREGISLENVVRGARHSHVAAAPDTQDVNP